MKHTAKTFLALALFALCSAQAFADTLASFSLTDFLGWTYTRPDFQLSTDAIGANKVRLFKASNGTDYTLVSPVIAVDGAGTVSIQATLLAPTCANKSYDLTKGSPTFELLDLGGNVVAAQFLQYSSAIVQRDTTVTLTVPAEVKSARLRIAAWNADYNSPVAVRSVAIAQGGSGVLTVNGSRISIHGTSGRLIVDGAQGFAMAVRDVQGHLLHSSTISASSASIELAAGLYLVTIDNKTSKIIIH